METGGGDEGRVYRRDGADGRGHSQRARHRRAQAEGQAVLPDS